MPTIPSQSEVDLDAGRQSPAALAIAQFATFLSDRASHVCLC